MKDSPSAFGLPFRGNRLDLDRPHEIHGNVVAPCRSTSTPNSVPRSMIVAEGVRIEKPLAASTSTRPVKRANRHEPAVS